MGANTRRNSPIAARIAVGLVVLLAGIVWMSSPADAGQPARNDRAVQKITDYSRTKGAPVPENPHAVPGEVLVKFKPQRAAAAMQAVRDRHHLSPTAHRHLQRTDWHVLKLNRSAKIKDLVEAYRSDPDVLYAEPNYYIQTCDDQVIPNDYRFSQLYGMHNTGQSGGTPDADIDAPEAWSERTSSDLIVAVIDSGVDYNHVDLLGNLWTNPDEIPGNGLDDDGNGLVDDVLGYDFINGDNDPMDDHSHGTHVAGTIGARGNNSEGVVGVCWTVQIMPLKVLDSSGNGSVEGATAAIEYATDKGARVINASWGSPPGVQNYSQMMYDAIEAAEQAGILFVAAAGNNYGNNNDVAPFYPSSYTLPNIIAVAATDRYDGLAGYSNIGLTTVDLAAPGSSIVSTTPGGVYGGKSGTSMATPHVAGACALVWAEAGPSFTYQQIKDAILDGVDPLPALSGKCVTGGRLNLKRTIDAVGAAQAGTDSFAYESRGAEAYVVQLDGSASREAASYSWVQIANGGLPVALRNADTATPDFDAPQWDGSTELTRTEATLRFRLTTDAGQPDEDVDDVEVYVRLPGDANGDDFVNAFDVALLRQIDPATDFNGDGIVNAFDVVVLRQNSGRRRTVD